MPSRRRTANWFATWRDAQPAAAFGARLLAAGAQPPAAFQPRGVQVCSCFDVGEAQIRATIDAVATAMAGARPAEIAG